MSPIEEAAFKALKAEVFEKGGIEPSGLEDAQRYRFFMGFEKGARWGMRTTQAAFLAGNEPRPSEQELIAMLAARIAENHKLKGVVRRKRKHVRMIRCGLKYVLAEFCEGASEKLVGHLKELLDRTRDRIKK